ncbi:MAG: transglutaminase family protein, partial [Planctomycetota bacterium]
MKQTLFIAVAMLSAWLFAPSSLGEESSVWTEFLEQAQDKFGDEGAEAARFLANNRPERDEQIGLDLLIENLDYALRAKQAFPWAKTLDGDLFMNDVLPYAIVDETREAWRASMHERASSIVNEAETATEAAQALNRELFNTINVHYNTGRKKPNQSIGESIEQGRATCTGLSIILVNACRSVGIPARLAGVANWHDGRGNHTWVEIWDGKNWRFTGADEYNKNGLDLAWFTADASKATAGDPVFGVWATSWKKTGHQFTMSWNDQDRSVHAVDVTHRYASDSQIAANESTHATRLIRVRSTNAGERLIAQLELINAEGTLT